MCSGDCVPCVVIEREGVNSGDVWNTCNGSKISQFLPTLLGQTRRDCYAVM